MSHLPTTSRPLIAAASAVLLLSTSIAAQAATAAFFDEIQQMPPGGSIGEWTVGGVQFTFEELTELDPRNPARAGALADVEFFMRDGQAVATLIAPHRTSIEDIVDGPHVFWREDGAEAWSFGDGEVRRQRLAPRDDGHVLQLNGSPEGTVRVTPAPPAVPDWSYSAPGKLLAVSDLEGNHDALRAFLAGNGVIDEDGHWAFGDGHLLFNGDTFDRGAQVTETLWLVLRLEREALAAGGRVHYVLGNHEVMVMGGDLRYIHRRYRMLCRRYGVRYDALYGADSHVGRWLRTRNTIIRIGRLLFVHAGYSPAVDRLQLSPGDINTAIRSTLGRSRAQATNLAESLSWSRPGPLWYRGYFPEHADEFGAFPTDAELTAMLERHEIDHIVVGHTLVPDVGWLDRGRRLIGIDVPWASPGEAEGLLYTADGLWRIDARGVRRELAVVGTAGSLSRSKESG